MGVLLNRIVLLHIRPFSHHRQYIQDIFVIKSPKVFDISSISSIHIKITRLCLHVLLRWDKNKNKTEYLYLLSSLMILYGTFVQFNNEWILECWPFRDNFNRWDDGYALINIEHFNFLGLLLLYKFSILITISIG